MIVGGSKYIFFCVLLISTCLSQEAVNIGDSWGGAVSFNIYEQKFKQINSSVKVTRYAVGGTTSLDWVSPRGLGILTKMFNQNPKLSHMWVTLGGNDAQGLCAMGRCDEYEAFVLKNLRTLFTGLVKIKPDLKIASLGYDLLNWDRNDQCMANFRRRFAGQTLPGFRREFIDRFTRIYSTLQKEFPKNVYYVPVWGELQKAGGIPNTPNVNYGSPSKYYADCIHPNHDGYTVLFTKFFRDLKER
eukprot:gene10642-3265_t